LLERPVGAATLVSAVRAALRARGRQYEVHDALVALTVSERCYRTLAEALPQLVWTSRPDGQRDYFSRQWVEYTGIPEEEQFGLASLDRVVHPEGSRADPGALDGGSKRTGRVRRGAQDSSSRRPVSLVQGARHAGSR
jgi:PAS domain-containing protein